MVLTRRQALGAAAAAGMPANPPARAQTGASGSPGGQKLKLGIITDLSGPYSDLNRPTMACAQQALEDFDPAGRGWDVEVLLAQHFDKADNAVTIARQWFDRDGVDALLDVNTSATSLAVAGIAREKNKPLLLSGPGTSE